LGKMAMMGSIMNNELTLEQLRFARLNGLNFYTGGTGSYNNHQFLKDIDGCAYCIKDNGTLFKVADESAALLDDVYKINFAPLDEAGQPAYKNKTFSITQSEVNHEKVSQIMDALDDCCILASQKSDMVNNPPHYQTDNGIECIDAIRAALGLDGFIAYCRGNAIKYGWRAGKKDETAQDLRKAAWYLDRAAQEIGK